MPEIQVGRIAPDFSLPAHDNTTHELSRYLGYWIILYFYPKDNTFGCTKEACSFRDHFANFLSLHTYILGVSVDSVDSHKKFSLKYQLPFTLLADDDKEVVKLYQVWKKKKMMGREYMGTKRESFLIDPQGIIAKIYTQVKPDEHIQEVLKDLSILKT